MKTVLVIAAHPDDEALGCGGTIAKYVSQGHKVHLVFMADGVNSRYIFDSNFFVAFFFSRCKVLAVTLAAPASLFSVFLR